MNDQTELKLALNKLAKIVKKSEALDGASHLDFTLVSSQERPSYQDALAKVNYYIQKGDITKEEFQKTLGIA